MHSEGNPSGPFVLGLLGLKLKGIRRASRIAWSAARASCVLRSVPKSKLMAGPAMSGLRRISRWVRVVLGATCKKTEFSAAKDWCIRLWVTFAAPVDAFARRLGFGDVHIWLVSRRMLSRWVES